ncbi:LuxR C-terminal-related transcriptional regulator [Actinoplanes sp. NPDC051859]|uniref:LuxR C-terminal-related transcriptional regulator n=1 Tax=Actinoplanes sp. NPDC051859 TaxID=3363909 RepID=UPI00379B43EA
MTLDRLGLDPLAQAVYRAMLASPSSDLNAISEIAGVSEPEARSAFDRLASLALVRQADDEISPPMLNNPSVALSALLAREQVRIAERQLQIEESRAAIAELLAAGAASGQGPDHHDVERVLGIDAARERISDLAANCQEEVWSFNPGGGQTAQNRANSRPLNAEALERGIRMRAVYLESVRNDPDTVDHVQWLTERGAEIRTTLTLPIRMLIIDRATAVVPIDDRATSQGITVITGRGMVAGLVALFVTTWKSAQPLSSRRSRVPGQPNSQERAALRLWAQGATDASVARTLGISERTVRRISENLAERLNARSRFEAGARAMDVGWLNAEDLV